MRIFLHGSRRSTESHAEAGAIIDKLAELATDGLLISCPLFESLRDRGVLPGNAEAVSPGTEIDADLAVSLGGDGSFLRTAQWVGATEVPILGVNAGHLGFLADMAPDEFLKVDAEYLKNLRKEPRTLLEVACSESLPSDCWPYALNDVAVLKTDSASMISVYAQVNGRQLTVYQADGLVVASPTGSTGYNLSVGGPILEPTVDMLLLSPVAPHQLAMRPLGVSGDSEIGLRVEARAGAFMLSLDGRSYPMPAGAEVKIRSASFKVVVAQRPSHHFAATLREKLLWGERPVNQ
ncbi:MAG: hypothetical protein E7082_08290 [Bacteroidales bacterium]|nr:hypothetical protein [Bacteroidales bacterium]